MPYLVFVLFGHKLSSFLLYLRWLLHNGGSRRLGHFSGLKTYNSKKENQHRDQPSTLHHIQRTLFFLLRFIILRMSACFSAADAEEAPAVALPPGTFNSGSDT